MNEPRIAGRSLDESGDHPPDERGFHRLEAPQAAAGAYQHGRGIRLAVHPLAELHRFGAMTVEHGCDGQRETRPGGFRIDPRRPCDPRNEVPHI